MHGCVPERLTKAKLRRLVSNHRARQQSRGIQNECQLRTHMNEGSKQRIQESERGHGNSHTVDGQCAYEILQNDAATASGNLQGLDEFREITANQDHIGALSGYIRSRT